MAFLLLLISLSLHATVYLGDGIRDSRAPWSQDLQGLCHDDTFYYITTTTHLWRIPRASALEKARKGVVSIPIPYRLRLKGGNHLGDCDAHQGLIFVPLEGIRPAKLLIFEAKTLKLKGAPNLPRAYQKKAPWVTVDHEDGSVISGDFNIKANKGLTRYRPSKDFRSLEVIGKIPLLDECGEPMGLKRVQGAEFVRSRNILWMVSDLKKGGLYGFNLATGRLERHEVIKYSRSFPQFEELEGPDTFEEGEKGFSPYQGNLFVMMLDNNFLRDTYYLKLYHF